MADYLIVTGDNPNFATRVEAKNIKQAIEGLELGNWSELNEKIEHALTHPEWRKDAAAHNRARVIAQHLYEHRLVKLAELL